MNIIVLVKQTFDTEEKIVIKDGKVVDDDVKFVLNPYDEYAVEEAIRIRDDQGGKVTVVSVGTERAIEALRTALAMGADEAVLINDERIGTDEHAVAQALAAFVGTESADLVLGGNFSVDNGAGQVAVRIAKLLGIPHVSAITKLDIADGRAVGSRDAEGDTEVVELPLPALFTAQQGLNEPRYPSLQGIMKAKKKPLRELTLDDFGVTAEARTAQTELFLPPQRQAGKLISGEPSAQAQELFRLLRTEAKVV